MPKDLPRRLTTEERAQARAVSLRRIGALFTGHRRHLAVVVAVIVLSSVISMGSPFLLREVIDVALPQSDLRLLSLLVAGMVGIAAATSALGVVQTWISTTVGQRVMHRLRTDVFAHLQRQSVGFFTRTRTGEVQSRITNDIGGMQRVVTSTATSVAANLTTVIATLVAMTALSWQLTLASLVALPPAIYWTRRVARMRQRITAQRQRELADLNVIIDEGLSISGVQLAKTMGAGGALIERFTGSSARLIDLELRSELAGRWRMATMNVVFAVIPAAIYLAAGLPFAAGAMSIGTLVAFTGLQTGLFRPLMSLLDVGVTLTASLALFQRIFEYLDLPVGIREPAEPVRLPTVRGHLRFEDVTFAYDGGATAALAGVSLDVPAGTSLALVGETGSGKSTIAALIARLHDPTSGRVTIDGADVRDLALDDLAAIVGVVSQETYLLHTTIRENLRYAKPGATDAEIERAARAAQIHDLIAALPDGYDTMVGSRGHRFSGGEKQRIAIARTLLRDPRILVLDEATSALDNETERAVQRAFDELSHGRTTVTIAHRLSTIRDADQIAVIDHGRILESGTHDTLLEAEGHYWTLAR
ncbi:multidrug ABC transporter ATP-binding protein [Actinoplanes lobatus]|uniref:ATP-binding cassette subfamily B protein n=1 Tax=Actinoplanes lobatus TaxID=113568 RepID=A0A7W7HHM8_9ACTN|nr:ABC transporter ATP-binding protein [Actinoplanes lobatus]MBB4750728.1 ATP-binding cassette subfamily B protein [Actinoplanes lobatus]GGN68889.1 multidrug ABC transporter ATP-binding protein [Actinoplanes lobatus]GIE42168.1 multidrug ABC transporter ATP-binding protein [Actinoplanes lobatus]